MRLGGAGQGAGSEAGLELVSCTPAARCQGSTLNIPLNQGCNPVWICVRDGQTQGVQHRHVLQGHCKCWWCCGNPTRSKGFGDTANPCCPPERGLPSVTISARAYERRTATDGSWGIVQALPSTQGASSVPVTLPCSLHFPTCCEQETGFAPRQDFCLTRNRVISCPGLQPWELRHQRSHTLASLRVFRKASC